MLAVLGNLIAKFSNPVEVLSVQFVVIARGNREFSHRGIIGRLGAQVDYEIKSGELVEP